jgi:large subunit ribosomal protein L29
MKNKELREKNVNELRKDLDDKKGDVQKLMFEVSVKQSKNHRDLRNAKRDVARLLTVINEKSKE